jgi:ABC-type nickel/cobalt efflux system permease component RcnA
MPRVIAAVALGLIAVMVVLYLGGADRVVQVWALDGQREAQTAMARGLRALRGGDPAALGGFLLVCFAYGFFHAAGPGHGKLLIGGYGAARSVGAVKLSAVALASSLAQGVSAVALVGAGLWIWQLGREEMTALADRAFAPLSFAAIALVGVWLVWRGARGLIAAERARAVDPNEGICSTCGHSHGPDPVRLAAATGWRDIAVLIGAVALRPCTGALFVLILTAQMGIFAIGIAGIFAMALGTASVTVAVALAAVTLRRGVLAGLTDNAVLVRAQPVLEIVIGAVIAVLATQLALAAL